jgi:hypothetical protein
MSSNKNVNENNNNNNNNNFVENIKQVANPVYEGLGTLGKISNIIKLVSTIIISIILIIIGYILIKAYDNKIKTSGRFSDISCNSTITADNKIQHLCSGYVVYKIDNKQYTRYYSAPYTIHNNQEIVVYYNQSNEEDFIISNNRYYIGIGMIGISIFILLATIVWTILSFKYKPLAAMSGIRGIRDFMR